MKEREGEVGRGEGSGEEKAEKNYRQFSFAGRQFLIVLLVILVRRECKVLGAEEDKSEGKSVLVQTTQAYGLLKCSNSFLTSKLE